MQAALGAALQAGEEILRIYGDPSIDLSVEAKSDDSPLTVADMAAHRVILGVLAGTDIPVLSEEGQHLPFGDRQKWRRFWLVDPLDGTREFLKRNGEFTVNIALVEDGQPILGVVYPPVLNKLYCGMRDFGAWRLDDAGQLRTALSSLNESGRTQRGGPDFYGIWGVLHTAGHFLPCEDLPANYTVVGSRSHMNDDTRNYLEGLKKQHGDVRIVSVGSSLKICLVAEGSAHEYPRMGPTMEWDTAAGQAIAEAAGKRVMLADGSGPLRYNRENLRNPYFVVR